tara:strand:+ start:647 stop:802 length:156 start_codon:yes stop_codon:yes gene_type:complete
MSIKNIKKELKDMVIYLNNGREQDQPTSKAKSLKKIVAIDRNLKNFLNKIF